MHEPDNHGHHPFALLAKAGLGGFPILADGDCAPDYQRLWTAAFSTDDHRRKLTDQLARSVLALTNSENRQSILMQQPSRRARISKRALQSCARPLSPAPASLHVIKSVHSPASADFVAKLTDADVVVIRRNPLNAVPSWLELGWQRQQIGANSEEERRLGEILGARPPEASDPMEVLHAWAYAALTRSLDIEAAKNPNWIVVQHEDLCAKPLVEFRSLFDRLGLDFTEAITSTIDANDRPAKGYTTQRIASDQPERWRKRLTDEQVRLIRRTAGSLSVEC